MLINSLIEISSKMVNIKTKNNQINIDILDNQLLNTCDIMHESIHDKYNKLIINKFHSFQEFIQPDN